jgi:hypothetical protein
VKDHERFRQRLASREVYHRRLLGAGRIGLILIAISLAIGMAGYAVTEHLGLLDAFLNASMILSGMGPIHEPATVAGKLFAGFYALYSGFAVLGIAAIMFSPVVHRLFHRFHIADTDDDPQT